jgi:hypothetical protein
MDNKNISERLKELISYFAFGDALGKDFEFMSPSHEQLKEKFYGENEFTWYRKISYTF